MLFKINMKILPFNEKYVGEMAELFASVYSEPGYEWDARTAKEYIERDYKYYPDFCFMALNEKDEIMGAIFCAVHPYYKSKMLLIDTLQVKDEYRKKESENFCLRQ